MSRYFVLIFLILGIGVGALLSLVKDVNIFVNMIVGALAGAAVGSFLQAKVEKDTDSESPKEYKSAFSRFKIGKRLFFL